jgi:hypothetical protein
MCSEFSSPIFTKNKNTILHEGVLEFIKLINEDMFVPFTIFENYKFTDLILYNTNTYIKNIFIATNSNTEQSLPQNQIMLLCDMSMTLIKTLSEFLNININNLSIDLILYMSPERKICPEMNIYGKSTCQFRINNYI